MCSSLELHHDYNEDIKSSLSTQSQNQFWIPRSHIKVNDTQTVVKVELHGVNVHDISLIVTRESYIILRGFKRYHPFRSDSRGPYGRFCRRFYFGPHINKENIKVRFGNGILTITVPNQESNCRRNKFNMSRL